MVDSSRFTDGDVRLPDEDADAAITVRTPGVYYPPSNAPRGIFYDDFQGVNYHPPHRGKWITFLTYDYGNGGGHFGNKYAMIQSNQLILSVNGDGDFGETDEVGVHAMTRAEFKTPFTTEFLVTPKDTGGYKLVFQFGLVDPDPRQGKLYSSNLYGRRCWHLSAYDDYSGDANVWVTDFGSESPVGSWVGGTTYRVKVELLYNTTPGPWGVGGLNAVVTIKDDDTGAVVWTNTDHSIDLPICGNYRCLLSVYGTEDSSTANEADIDEFSVSREVSKKTKAIVSFEENYYPDFWLVADDEDFSTLFTNWSNINGSNDAADKTSGTQSFVLESVGSGSYALAFFDGIYPDPDDPVYDLTDYDGFYFSAKADSACNMTIKFVTMDAYGFFHYFTGLVPVTTDWTYPEVLLKRMTREAGLADWAQVVGWEVYIPNGRTVKLDYLYLQGWADVIVAEDDVIDLDVSLRDGSCPSARVSLNNRDQKYAGLDVTDEIEIRAGWEHIMWLLFKGYIDTPEASFPPETMEVSSSKGYEKRLDFLETDSESWASQWSDDIIGGLVADYFGGTPPVFRFNWNLGGGGVQVDVDSNDEAIGGLIKKLADMGGTRTYVDWNRELRHVQPGDDWTQANLEIFEEKDVISITNRLVDEVLNVITVKGDVDTETEGSGASIARYWMREKTFSDENLTSAGSVQFRAEGLLDQYYLPMREITANLPEFFIVDLYDHLILTCPKVGLYVSSVEIKGATYSYTTSGLRTSLQAYSKGFRLSDVLADHDKRLTGILG
jgi:hypothetical protein